MLPLTLNGAPLRVPTSWADVTTARFAAWASACAAGAEPLACVAALLGVEAEVLASVEASGAELLFSPLEFLAEPLPELPPINIGGEAYLAVEEARLALRKAHDAGQHEATAYAAVWARLMLRKRRRTLRPDAEYDQARARTLEAAAAFHPCTEVVPEARALLAGLSAFFERHAELFEPSEDDDVAQEADVARFNKYGHLGPVIALAGPVPSEWNAVYQSPAESVYLSLRYRRDQSEYQDDLRAVMAARATPNS